MASKQLSQTGSGRESTAPPLMDLDLAQPERRAALLRLLRAGGLGAAAAGAGLWLSARSRRPQQAAVATAQRNLSVAADPQWPAMVVAQGADPAALVRLAVGRIGGMRRFVSRGDRKSVG